MPDMTIKLCDFGRYFYMDGDKQASSCVDDLAQVQSIFIVIIFQGCPSIDSYVWRELALS